MNSALRRSRTAAELRAEMARQKMTAISLHSALTDAGYDMKLPTLRNRINGQKPLNLEDLAAICRVLGVGVSVLNDRVEASL